MGVKGDVPFLRKNVFVKKFPKKIFLPKEDEVSLHYDIT
jgi:hypothetical protein